MSRPLVSVILPVHDRSWCVARAIESVLAQTFRDFELIVIDDGSTDGSRAIIQSFGDAVRLFSRPRRGAYAARNFALQQAKGELIAFIDSDDAWHPEKLAMQVPLFDRPEVGLVFADVAHVTRELAPLGRTSFAIAPPQRGRAAEAFAACNFVPTITAIARRNCLEEIGGFSESHPISADLLAWFRIALRHELDYVGRPLADYTVHTGGISADLGRAIAARIELFSHELAQTTDRSTRRILRRILFTLALRLVVAIVRGKARHTPNAFTLARRTLATVGGFEAGLWSAALIAHEIRVRSRRVLA